MKVYAIMDGYYSSTEGAQYDSFWSTKELADKELKRIIYDRKLEPVVSKKTGKDTGVYADYDYYCYVIVVELDKELI